MHLQRSQKTWGIKFIEFLNSRISKIIWWSRKLFIKIKCIRSGQSNPPCRIQYLCSLAVVLGGAASECKSNSKSRSWFNRNGAIYFHKSFLKIMSLRFKFRRFTTCFICIYFNPGKLIIHQAFWVWSSSMISLPEWESNSNGEGKYQKHLTEVINRCLAIRK